RRPSAPARGDLIRAVAVSDHLYPLGHQSRPTESFSKQARAILYIGPGHFESIQSFSKQLDLSILGNQPRKEELMNSSSRFARHRSGLEFCKDLVGSIDQHLGILELETGIDVEHGLEKAGDRVSARVLGRKSERRKIRKPKGAIFRKHLPRLLRISEREGGVFKHEFLGIFHGYSPVSDYQLIRIVYRVPGSPACNQARQVTH